MDFRDISRQIKELRQELETIRDHNRQYYLGRTHDVAEQAAHRKMQERVVEIRNELGKMLLQLTPRQ